MTATIIGVVGLVVIFALSMWRGVSMGAIALFAAFALGTFYFGMKTDDVSAQFPTNLLVTLVGVTFFFGLARANGTVARVVDAAVGLTRGKAWALPWVFFILAAIITGSGALSAATNAILVPVGLAFASRYRISPLLMGLSILNGTNAGGFSPIAVYFSIVNGVLVKSGITVDPMAIFIGTFIFNLVLNLVAFFLLGGRGLLARHGSGSAQTAGAEVPAGSAHTVTTAPAGTGTTTAAEVPAKESWTWLNYLTLVLFLAILGLGLFAKLDVGYLALGSAVLLGLIAPRHVKDGMDAIGWGVVLLIGGIVTYVGVLQEAGVVDTLANGITGIGSVLVASLLIMYVAGIVSAFASTNAMFGVLVPTAAPLLLGGQLPLVGFVLALSIAASAVDSSPFSTGGALVVANTEEDKRDKTFKGLMAWGMSMTAIVPLVVWLLFLVGRV
ncbi:SLC13 family permease [Brevibacterium sp. 50QC2O2]|uniref:SLC13 family permease n=1 Tax=Brevibacterium sp. 50QC2O2 TaxID=2968459 RepID=UPI00211C1305|nr:SLC13 family permease [Brevibacterium sp. 50QC2O2]MCQ9388488.1 SLC13 family permease [Brevibacterium sp. 50QC2O2]